jgi:UDP-N-acetylmuramate dehydrogenase
MTVTLDAFEKRARAIVADRVRRDVPLAPLTTFKVGGVADCLIEARSEDELAAIVAAARECHVPVTMLGGGSNVLVADRGVRGAVLRLAMTGLSQPAPGCIRAEAGVTINGLVRWAVSRGLANLEAWAGTPGTVGGAIYGNAHYGGRNIGDLVTEVRLIDPGGRVATVPRDQIGFAYDTSRLHSTHEVVVWADFAVTSGTPETLRAVARASLAHRKGTQPLASQSAGCIFQNPDPARDAVPPGIPASAGALVDRAGLKGHRIGGARISPLHANFFVNEAGASAADIRALVGLAKAEVRRRFGVELREEIVYMGEF